MPRTVTIGHQGLPARPRVGGGRQSAKRRHRARWASPLRCSAIGSPASAGHRAERTRPRLRISSCSSTPEVSRRPQRVWGGLPMLALGGQPVSKLEPPPRRAPCPSVQPGTAQARQRDPRQSGSAISTGLDDVVVPAPARRGPLSSVGELVAARIRHESTGTWPQPATQLPLQGENHTRSGQSRDTEGDRPVVRNSGRPSQSASSRRARRDRRLKTRRDAATSRIAPASSGVVFSTSRTRIPFAFIDGGVGRGRVSPCGLRGGPECPKVQHRSRRSRPRPCSDGLSCSLTPACVLSGWAGCRPGARRSWPPPFGAVADRPRVPRQTRVAQGTRGGARHPGLALTRWPSTRPVEKAHQVAK